MDFLMNQVKFLFCGLSQQKWTGTLWNLINIKFLENQIGVFEKRLAGLMAKGEFYARVIGFLILMQSMFERAFLK